MYYCPVGILRASYWWGAWDKLDESNVNNNRRDTEKKTVVVWTHIQNGDRQVTSESSLLSCYWRTKPRKTSKKVDGKHQGRLRTTEYAI